MGATGGWMPARPTRPEVAVFVSGVTSMGLEILAGRVIAPQFGSSIYTWGSIIGVFLAALAYGYHRGGRVAAARATRRRLARPFLLVAIYVAVLVYAGPVLLRLASTAPVPHRFASLPAVLLLFGPPTYLLGYVSPYAAELSRKDGLGEASGHVYALGTVGSLVGVFGTTYLLVPALDVERIGITFGLLSVGTVAYLSWPEMDRRRGATVVAVALLVVLAGSSGVTGVAAEGKVVHQTQTPYQELRVVDLGDTRTLYLDRQPHSAMDLDDPDRHVFDYTRHFHLPFLLTEDVDRVLFVGGGGFTGPKDVVRTTDATVDVVELDPAVIDAAKTYFGVEPSDRLRIHNADGRRFLAETNRTYDVIVLDAYRKDKVPFHLTTVEFMRLAADRLDDDGVLLANVVSAPTGPGSRFYRAQYRTMDRVFPRVYSFPTVEGPVIQNVIVVATKDPRAITEAELLERNERRRLSVDLTDEIETFRVEDDLGDAPVLRDDYAPVDRLLDPMMGQRYVIQAGNRSVTATG